MQLWPQEWVHVLLTSFRIRAIPKSGGYGLILLLLVLLWLAFAVTAYVAWRKISRDLAYCWNQVGDEDHYLAQQAHRIDMLSSRYSDLNDRITETSNELSMTHDYVSGLHFSVVEGGGLLQHGLGLTNDQWVHLNTLERANMQAFHSMSSGTYMQLIRQRSRAIGPADATDSPNMDEHAESESRENDMEVDPNLHTVHYGQSVSEMYEALKCEQRLCISNGDNRDSSVIQNLLLMSYKQPQTGLTADTVRPFRSLVSSAFRELHEVARAQQRWGAADRYQAVAAAYTDG